MSTVDCVNCGTAVPRESRFCPECGHPLHQASEQSPRRRYWTPPDIALTIGIVAGVIGVVLLGAQLWLWAALALLLSGVVLLYRWEAGRRGAGLALSRIGAHRELVAARSRGQLELFRRRRDLAELQAERSRGYHELGRATHLGDGAAAGAARAQLDDVAVRIQAKEAEINALAHEVEERVRRVQAQSAPTRQMEAPLEPARVPEPSPPLDEGNPPEPAQVPEPSPAPMPEPSSVPVPEPSPDEPPPQPEHPPAPQSRRRRTSRARKG
jgi:predicted nucleic acid-binding Zn ribbon protein